MLSEEESEHNNIELVLPPAAQSQTLGNFREKSCGRKIKFIVTFLA